MKGHIIFLSFLLILTLCLATPVSSRSPAILMSKKIFKNFDDDIPVVTADLTTRARKLNDVKLQGESKRMSGDKQTRNTEAITLEMKHCLPYPSIVKVEEQGVWGEFYWPSFVELHRCVGGCYVSPRFEQCKVTQQENVVLKVRNIDSNVEHTISIANHTACDCACVRKVCNERQWYNEKHCRCECLGNGGDCKKDNKRWNKQSCQCECINAPDICSPGEKWSTDSCRCEPNDNGSVVGRF